MIDWEEWETKPVRVLMKRFTGFGEGGNGYDLQRDLEDRGVMADIFEAENVLRIQTREREESITRLGDWVVIGSRTEVYPIDDDVQGDKYRRPGS